MASKPSILVLNGPNLNLLGSREPELYGATSLAEIEADCTNYGNELGLAVSCVQTNHEGELVELIQSAIGKQRGLIINAAAYTHTSLALQDALRALDIPVIEVHLTNIHARETVRHHSYIAPVASGIIMGFGAQGYRLALVGMANKLGL